MKVQTQGSAPATAYPERDALLAHQRAYQELAGSIESMTAVATAKRQECLALLEEHHNLPAMLSERDDLLARIAMGESLQKELAALDGSIKTAEASDDEEEKVAYDLACAVEGLKRKITGDIDRLEQMREQWQVLVRRFLLAEAEREAQTYTEHAMALLSSYRKLRCLDHLRTQDKGTQPFTLVAGAGTLEVPSFDLEACKPYVDFTFTSRLVTHQNRAYGVTLKAAETLKTALAEAGIMLEPPPAIRLPANLEPGEEALAQGRGE